MNFAVSHYLAVISFDILFSSFPAPVLQSITHRQSQMRKTRSCTSKLLCRVRNASSTPTLMVEERHLTALPLIHGRIIGAYSRDDAKAFPSSGNALLHSKVHKEEEVEREQGGFKPSQHSAVDTKIVAQKGSDITAVLWHFFLKDAELSIGKNGRNFHEAKLQVYRMERQLGEKNSIAVCVYAKFKVPG